MHEAKNRKGSNQLLSEFRVEILCCLIYYIIAVIPGIINIYAYPRHKHFEAIHPFQDGNGRVGRLIMFKECLRNGITPFIVEDDIKDFYYRGLREWNNEKGYLTDTILTCQDHFKKYLDYFGII